MSTRTWPLSRAYSAHHPLPGFAGLAALFLGFIALDQILFRTMFSPQVLFAASGFFLLIWRKSALLGRINSLPKLTLSRLAICVLLHAGLLAIAVRLMPSGETTDTSPLGFLGPALRLTLLLPGIFLLPISTWKQLVCVFRAEFIAALVILLTFDPYRIALLLWNHHGGNLLAAGVYVCLKPLFHDAFFSPALQPLIGTARFPAALFFPCAGVEEIALFQELFGTLIILEWRRLSPRRALVVYLMGSVAVLVGNVLRIVSLIAVGTLGLPRTATDALHDYGGGLFAATAFLIVISLTFRWMQHRLPLPGQEPV